MEPDQPPHDEANLKDGITGIVLTLNGERLLDECLSSLSFCNKILVVDSGSTDTTFEIAKKYNAQIASRDWDGFAPQFTYAHSLVETRWFFILDQDEICPPLLGDLIIATVRKNESSTHLDKAVAYSVGRKSWYFDRFMEHTGWYPDHILRLFKTGFMEFYQDAHIHYRPLGSTEHIGEKAEELIHYPYTGFFHQWDKLNTYSEQGADAIREAGGKGGVLKGIGHGLGRFFKLFVLKAGFLDGRAGFLAASHGAFYAFSKYVRVLEASWGEPFDWEAQEKMRDKK